MTSSQLPADLQLQVRVSKWLGLGFALTCVSVAGFGSLLALIIGWWARKMINQSETKLAGIWMAWWCIVVGGTEALILIPATFWIALQAIVHQPR